MEAEIVRKMRKQASIYFENSEEFDDDVKLPWYLFRKDSTTVILWNLVFTCLVGIYLFFGPFWLALPKSYGNPFWIDIFSETVWIIQIVMRMLTADPPRTTNLRSIVREYASGGMLMIDVLATVPSLILILLHKKKWAMYLMILRWTHAD